MSADPAASPLQKAKHEAVLQAYLADAERVGWRAYVSVYPNSSEPAAKTAFSRLLKNAGFAARLKFLDGAATEIAVEKSGIAIADVVTELAKIGFANMQDYLRFDGAGQPTLDWSNLTRDQAAAIASVEIDSSTIAGLSAAEEIEEELEGQPHGGALKRRHAGEPEDLKVTKVKFKLHNKQAALVSILDHLGGFPARKHELTGKDGGPIETEDKTERSDLDVARRIAFVLAKAARGTIAGGAPAPVPQESESRKAEDGDG
jgi:phage terminase small subunit